ncbi:MAG TPA: rhomboid family intramembrane serine protease [Pyrinomonadaceae bacterium]
MCRNCSAIVGAGETVCPQCSSPLAQAEGKVEARRSIYDRKAQGFMLDVLKRPYKFTILFLVANIFVFLLMWSSSGLQSSALVAFPSSVLDAYGAKLNYLIDGKPHQWWRFVTPIFIHVNLPHILINMWSLWVVGPYVEKLYGSAKFVFFWVLTGVAGVVASYLTVRPEMHVNSVGRFLFKTMDNPSAGASGALFGLVGVLFVFGIKFRHELPDGFKRAFGTGLLPMILMNLFIGFLGRGFIDNAAHLGGFAAGALTALFVGYKRPGERGTVAIIWHILQLAALVLVALSFLMVARNFPGRQSLNVSGRQAYIEAINQGQRALITAMTEGDASAIDAATKALDNAPHLDDEATAIVNGMKPMLESARNYTRMTPGKERESEANKIEADYESWKERRDRWVKENGDKYGIEFTPLEDSQDNTDKK